MTTCRGPPRWTSIGQGIIETGLDPDAVLAAARDVAGMAGIPLASHAGAVGTRAELLRLGAERPAAHPA